MTQASHEGGCLCGAIRYRVEGPPSDTNLCFCTQCQRQTGSPMPAFATYPVARFRLLSGKPADYRASPDAVRQFCAACGSTLFWQRDGDDKLDVFMGTLDDPASMPPPDDQIWAMHRARWLPELPGVTSYPRERGSR